MLIDTTVPPVTVVEPLLEFALPAGAGVTVTNLTNFGLDPDGGDILEYQISLVNNGTSEAFDTNIVATMSPELAFDAALPAPTALINGVAVVGFNSTPLGAPGGPLIWGKGNADNSLDVPDGETLVLTYRAIVQTITEPNTVLDTTVTVDWTSLEDNDPSLLFERTGKDCPAFTAPDDYCTTELESITAINDNSITKDRTADSNLNTGDVRVGDIVDYTLTLRIQEGTTRAVSLVDTLPNGLEFVSVLSVNGDPTAPYTSAGVFTHADINAPVVTTGVGDNTISWTLGDAVTGIVNAPDNIAANDNFVIVYRAQVVNDELPMPQDASTNLTNNAVLEYQDSGNTVINLNDTEIIAAQQPIIFTADLSKVRRGGLPSGNPVASGEVMDFRLSACNSGGAPAYDLIVDDLLPVELDETTITPPVVTINGGATIATDYVYTAPVGPGGTMRFLFNNEAKPVNPGQCAVIEFDVTVKSPIGINQTFINQFQAVEYHSLDSDNLNQLERESYGPASALPFSMNTTAGLIDPDKSLVSPLSHEATIGEIITYQIKVPGDSGTMSVDLFDVLISDDMASNLTFVDATLNAGSTYAGSFDTSASADNKVRIGIDLLPVMAGITQQAVFNIRARVNNDANTNALLPVPTPAFGNLASYTFTDTDGGNTINGGSAATPGVDDISIVEPVLAVAKSVVNTTKPGPPDAGDKLTYSVTLTASGGGVVPADFFSSAFDVSIDDTLSRGLLYIDNSATVDGVLTNTIIAPATNGADGISTAQTLSWSLVQGNADIDVVEGTTVTVTYDVLVLDTVLANQDLSNTVDVQWSSRDGPDVNERDGSGLPLNDYFNLVSATTLETTPDSNTILKSRLGDTYNPVAPNDNIVRIGDIVEYHLLINMQEGTSPNFVIQDTLDEGLIFEETVSINGQPVAPYAAVAPFTHTAIPAAIVAGNPAAGPTTVTWTPGGDVLNPGDVINAGDNDTNNDDFVIVYRARVLNLALPQLPTIQPLDNNVDFDYLMASGPARQQKPVISRSSCNSPNYR